VSDSASATFDFASLQELTYDKDKYGRVLGDNLFKANGIGSGFKEARDEAALNELPLRVRLFVDPSALELHGLLWETIRDPEADVPLLMNENVLFSRYLTSVDWRRVGVRPNVGLRAVVLVANPSDVEDYHAEERPPPPIDVAAELEQARVGLGDLGLSPAATTELVGNRCSLGALCDGAATSSTSSVMASSRPGSRSCCSRMARAGSSGCPPRSSLAGYASWSGPRGSSSLCRTAAPAVKNNTRVRRRATSPCWDRSWRRRVCRLW
jgi:hypothetical protein